MDNNEVIKTAFRLACQYLRDHPPLDGCDDLEITTKCIIGGNLDDPRGLRWMSYFIEKAIEENRL